MTKFVSEWFEFEESNDASCVTLGVGIVNCGDIIQEDSIDDFNVDKFENLDEQIGLEIESQGEEDIEITNCGNLDEELVDHFNVDKIKGEGEEIDFIGVVKILNGSIKGVNFIDRLVGTIGVGFEKFKTKRVRQCHRCIFLIFSAFHWSIILNPLWFWNVLRRSYSIGVYHSHKPKRDRFH
ncbi:hypothetical protein L484_016465 [Morus notabilis]|uniref:Uncharacterized protein n=1 Tax=Morus notabilis TaxID=981085 RepID=W9QXT8_9ROSA|nr:hypothetical protein L484_016465 [Morus notabilis]